MRHALLSLGTALTVLAATIQLTTAQQQPGAQAPPDQEGPPVVFRSGVELMNLSVTVTDKRGRSVNNLTKDDFVVFEDKKPQEILNFSSTKEAVGIPIGLGLVLDASASMTNDRLQAMRTAVELMVNRRIRKDDEMYFVEFATDARLITPWTTDKRSVIDAVRRIRVREGTAIYNAIMAGLQVSRAGKHKKQVMLVITDGADTHSTVKRQDVAIAARASDVVIYALVVTDESTQFGRGDGNLRAAAGELSAVTDVTGGRTEYVQGFSELEDSVAKMGEEFTQQYEIAYQRPAPDGKFHDIVVGVKRTDVTVRHRRQYLANTTPAAK